MRSTHFTVKRWHRIKQTEHTFSDLCLPNVVDLDVCTIHAHVRSHCYGCIEVKYSPTLMYVSVSPRLGTHVICLSAYGMRFSV